MNKQEVIDLLSLIVKFTVKDTDNIELTKQAYISLDKFEKLPFLDGQINALSAVNKLVNELINIVDEELGER